jgi:hypothetical protein
MTGPPDPLSELRDALMLALNPDALRLLRSASEEGVLYRSHSLRISGADVTRTSAEDLTDRLERAGLLERRPQKRPVVLGPTDFCRAVLDFIDLRLDVGAPRAATRPTVLVLAGADRSALEDAGFALDDVLRQSAADIAMLADRAGWNPG